ncbi:hypothetical protein [Puia sp.]|jgi:hypothetical protein|uniref:hypothetical protein n=1 Tax=Puia sp. TaxID=2045100 RepID=UPI002F41F3B4
MRRPLYFRFLIALLVSQAIAASAQKGPEPFSRQEGRVSLCAAYTREFDNYDNENIVVREMKLLTFGNSVNIPISRRLSFQSSLVKFINGRYGTNLREKDIKNKNPIRLILDKENQRRDTHVAKSG